MRRLTTRETILRPVGAEGVSEEKLSESGRGKILRQLAIAEN